MSSVSPCRVFVSQGETQVTALDPKAVARHLALVKHPANFIGKANGWRTIRGGEAGVGYILMRRDSLLSLDRTLSNLSITFQADDYPAPAGTVTISNLHITNAIAVAGTTAVANSDVYLVEFKDNFDYAWFSGINKAYNVRTPNWVSSTDFLEDSVNSGTPWTWEDMLDDIWGNVSPLAGGLDTTDADFPTTKPDNFVYAGTKAFAAAIHVAKHLNHILYLSRSGVAHLVAPDVVDTDNNTLVNQCVLEGLVLNPSNPLTSTKTTVPQFVKVYFPTHYTAFQNSTDQATNMGSEIWNVNATYTETVTSSSVVSSLLTTGTITGAVETLYDSLPAIYDELGVLQNTVDLSNRAQERVALYLNSIISIEGWADDLYNGPIPFELGTSIECIHWYDFGDGVRTQTFVSSPKKMAGSGSGINEITEWPGMPDLSRYHLPYERFAIGEVYNATINEDGSGIVRILYGTRTSASVTDWAQTSLPHEVTAFDGMNQCHKVGTRVYMVFHRQVSRWIIIGHSNQEELDVVINVTWDGTDLKQVKRKLIVDSCDDVEYTSTIDSTEACE